MGITIGPGWLLLLQIPAGEREVVYMGCVEQVAVHTDGPEQTEVGCG